MHPGAKATWFDVDGHRGIALPPNAPRSGVAFLDARHRVRGRGENRFKTLKASGMDKLPFAVI